MTDDEDEYEKRFARCPCGRKVRVIAWPSAARPLAYYMADDICGWRSASKATAEEAIADWNKIMGLSTPKRKGNT